MKAYILTLLSGVISVHSYAVKPNIILIVADDLGYNDVGEYGQQFLKTPNIDKLAKTGVKFTDFYAGAPVCSPSRCVLMTGLHTGHTTIRGNGTLKGGTPGPKQDKIVNRANLNEDDYTIGNLMQKAGYKTCLVGKWHLGGYDIAAGPLNKGFNEFYGWLIRTPQTYSRTYWPEKRYRNSELYDIKENKDGNKGYYETDICNDEAISFLENNYKEPFFLTVCYTSPHSPLDVQDLYPFENESWPEHMKTYAAMVYKLDQSVGNIVKTIERLGLNDNTILIFSSDNGPRSDYSQQLSEVADFFDSNGKLRGYKRDLYEGGIRVPMIVWSPRFVRPGSVNSTPCYFADLLPTLADITKVKLNKSMDGLSFYQAIKGRNEPNKSRFMYWEFFENGFEQAVRYGKWKAVKRKGILELYDLNSDIGEQKDIAIQHPDLVSSIETYLKDCRTESPFWPTN